ncbi:NAD(P)-binding protein [Byssothecium circinans]|uniref:NAD(P)-binding protein n=1 Tax=Byssothecium circinans TaxID=147558 RepID=A0A6A5TLD4_9PLEO|nr:NAD(P)-binding protein [Byssothecium circinans]
MAASFGALYGCLGGFGGVFRASRGWLGGHISGVKHLVLIGRTESTLRETEGLIPANSATVSAFASSVTDEAGLKKIAETVGAWDILILNAAHISAPAPLVKAPLEEYWSDYETNVKSIIIAVQAFVPNAKAGAAVYAIAAGALVLPPKLTPYLSGYLTSKLAQLKVMEYLAAENPDLFVCSVHPGMVDTKIFRGSGASPDQLPMDTATLPAHFLVWLSQPKTKFLNGKLVWANWDVEELFAKAEEIQNSTMLTIGYEGWPFVPAA